MIEAPALRIGGLLAGGKYLVELCGTGTGRYAVDLLVFLPSLYPLVVYCNKLFFNGLCFVLKDRIVRFLELIICC